MLPERVHPAFLQGLEILRLSKPGIQDFDELNESLHRAMGWTFIAVPGLVPDAVSSSTSPTGGL
jgi:phenylalanine-4-hydroxylase